MDLSTPEQVDKWRARLSQAPAAISVAEVEKGRLLAVPKGAYEKRTKYTPDVPGELDGQPRRLIHKYHKLGEGSFGTVFQAVDLATGSLWAVKRCRDRYRDGSDILEMDIKSEVEKLARLKHVCLSNSATLLDPTRSLY